MNALFSRRASALTKSFLQTPQVTARFKRYEAFEAQFDSELLEEARAWYQGFDASQLPKGSTTFVRSSGPGGQHVNKTETKATTVYRVEELTRLLPRNLHTRIRASKYYVAGNDSLTFHAQTQRSRAANADENRRKLMDEVTRIYQEATPAKSSNEKKKKHEQIEKRFHEARIKQKKLASSKKQSRRGPVD